MSRPTKRLRQWLTFDVRDQHERAFCERWASHRRRNLAWLLLAMMVAFHVSGVAQSFTILGSELRAPFAWYHAVGLVLTLAVIALARLRPAWVRVLAMATGTLYAVGYAITIHFQDFAAMQLVVITAVVLSSAIIGFLCFFPGSQRGLLVATVLIMGGIVFAYGALPGAPLIIGEYLVVIAFGWLFHLQMTRRELAHGRLEYRTRLKMAPAQIVRQARDFTEDVALAFPNGMRACVCISSDWRGYQSLTATTAPEALAALMQGYYELVDRLLNETFPAGNYFSDWIADELFVVVFAASRDDTANLANQAMTFGQRLLAAKADFAGATSQPIAIDVGLACGLAYLGLLGPKSHRKATALGEIPGRARRLQGVGALLRAAVGPADRVIFGTDILAALLLPVEVKTYQAGSRPLRDLKDDEIFYVEATLATDDTTLRPSA